MYDWFSHGERAKRVYSMNNDQYLPKAVSQCKNLTEQQEAKGVNKLNGKGLQSKVVGPKREKN